MSATKNKAIPALRVSQASFACVMLLLGIVSLFKGDFAPIWQPTPKSLPAREVLVYLSASISLFSGLGLLWQRTAAVASRVLVLYLVLWLLLFRVPKIFVTPATQDTWSGCAETATIVAGAWVLYGWFTTDWDRRYFDLVSGAAALRLARTLYGLALIPFGLAHFRYLKETASLVPHWLPGHMALAFFTGCTFLAAGVAILTGICARLGAALSALQLGLFTLLIWAPTVAAPANAFQWSEFYISLTITAAAWLVADSYRVHAAHDS